MFLHLVVCNSQVQYTSLGHDGGVIFFHTGQPASYLVSETLQKKKLREFLFSQFLSSLLRWTAWYSRGEEKTQGFAPVKVA